jgi:hypothetical protein
MHPKAKLESPFCHARITNLRASCMPMVLFSSDRKMKLPLVRASMQRHGRTRCILGQTLLLAKNSNSQHNRPTPYNICVTDEVDLLLPGSKACEQKH